MLLLVRERGVFDALRFCKKKTDIKRKAEFGRFRRESGAIKAATTKFCGNAGMFGDFSEKFLRREMKMLRKILRFGVLARAFYAS